MKQLKKALVVAAAFSALAVYGGQRAAAADADLAWGGGTVIADALNIRCGPGTEYEILGRAYEDSVLLILENTGERWYRINYEGIVGYVDASYLGNVEMAKNFEAEGTVTGDAVRLRSSHDTDSEVLGKYYAGDRLHVIGINAGWFKVTDGDVTGYIRSDYMEITGSLEDLNEEKSESAGTAAVSGTGSAGGAQVSEAESDSTGTKGQDIVDYALGFVGYKYRYGGESPEKGFDCSGFTCYIYSQFGYSINRTANSQYKSDGVKVSRDELQPGDIVCFSDNGSTVTHVGIYIGDGKFVHAENSRTGVVVTDLSLDYYARTWWGGKRIID